MSPPRHDSRRPILLDPGRADDYVARALALLGSADDMAQAALRRALLLQPLHLHALIELSLLARSARPAAAAQAALKAALASPDVAVAYNAIAMAVTDLGQIEDAARHSWRAVVADPTESKLHSNHLLGLNYLDMDPVDLYRAHREFDRRHGAPCKAAQPRRTGPGKLRIGYVSGDFRLHPCAFFVGPLLAGHDRERFHIVAFANVAHPDGITDRLARMVDGWIDISSLDDGAAARAIRDTGIDMLVDLSGHTAANRLTLFAQRPAPVQASWLGYCNTTGLSNMDFRVTDAIADPAGEADRVHSERLVRLPKGFLCYGPPAHAGAVGPLPCTRTKRVTLGCFNRLPKITGEVVEVWAGLLRRLPSAVLRLRGEGDAKLRYEALFERAGVPAHQLMVRPRVSGSDTLAAYADVDIALDPFPDNGTTTTCEALWMGVPVVTLAGRRHASRVSASLLTQVGLTECIADSPAGYIEAVAALTTDVERLAALRAGLRRRMAASSLCDYRDFAGRMEAAYQAMWDAR